MDRFYVYKHLNSSNQPFYVGKGIKDRAYVNTRRNDIWNELSSEGYEVSIIKYFNTSDEALEFEAKLIKLYKKYGFCKANIKNGGSQYRMTDKIRQKMSKSIRAKQPYFKAFDKENNEVYSGNSQIECSSILFNNKMSQSKISDCLRNIRITHRGYRFSLAT